MAGAGFALAQAFVRIRPDATGFRASAESQVKTALAGVSGKVKLSVDSDLAKTKITELRGYLTALTQRAWDMSVGVNDKPFQLAIQRIFLSLEKINRNLNIKPTITIEGIARAQAQLLAIDVLMDELAKKRLPAAGPGFKGWFTKIPLFGGALGSTAIVGQIGAIRLATSVTVEFLSVLIPATVALLAFGAVGADTAVELAQRFQIFNTVGRALHENLLPLGGDFAKMEKAVQPQVYALFGDVLQVASSKAGTFARLVREAGAVVDQLGARATLALRSAGLSQFLRNAAPDLQKLGTIGGNIFGTIGNLLKSLTGYAQILLDVWVHLTGALEAITASPVTQWAFRIGLGFHGLATYVGLLATGLFLLGRPLGFVAGALTGVSSTADKSAGILAKAHAGWSQLASSITLVGSPAKVAGTAVEDASIAAEDGARRTGLLARAFGGLSASFGWTGLAIAGAAALGVLIYALVTSKDATQRWADNFQNAIAASRSFGDVSKATAKAVVATGAALSEARKQAASAGSAVVVVGNNFRQYNVALDQARTKVGDLTSAHQRYQQELQTENSRLQELTRLFGSASVAQGLLNQAGISASSIATQTAAQFKQTVQTLQSLKNAYDAIAYSAGNAGNNERIMNLEISDQFTATQKLTSAWSQYIDLVSGTQSAFDTVAQGFAALDSTGEAFKETLGKLSVAAKFTKSGIDSLTPSGIALNQAFSAQIGNIEKLAATWAQAGLSTRAFNTGMRAAISTLLPFAAGSTEATAQLAALASLAGYQGPVDFRSLQLWVGNVSNALGILKKTSDEATLSQVELTGAFQGTGNAIAQKLLGQINNAIFSYHGVYKAATDYGNAVAKYGKQSQQAQQSQFNLEKSIIGAGIAAHQTTGEIAGLLTKILGIPKQTAVNLVMAAEGNYTIFGAAVFGSGQKTKPLFSAAGALVPGYGGGDRHPAMLEGGESVVPKHLTPYVAPFLASQGVPGFAGGVIGAFGNSVLSGQFAFNAFQMWGGTSISVLVTSMRAALYATEQAALAAAKIAGYSSLGIYDSGGFLPPGLSMAYNGTGRPEAVGGGGKPHEIRLVVEGGDTDFGQFMVKFIRRFVRIQGGGSVQVAFGKR